MINLTIYDLLVRNASIYPERIVVEDETSKLTHSELLNRAVKVGNALSKLGCELGSRVAIISRNSNAMMEIMCACEIFGFIAVPLNHRLATNEIKNILIDCTPSILIGESFFKAVLHEVHPQMPKKGLCGYWMVKITTCQIWLRL